MGINKILSTGTSYMDACGQYSFWHIEVTTSERLHNEIGIFVNSPDPDVTSKLMIGEGLMEPKQGVNRYIMTVYALHLHHEIMKHGILRHLPIQRIFYLDEALKYYGGFRSFTEDKQVLLQPYRIVG